MCYTLKSHFVYDIPQLRKLSMIYLVILMSVSLIPWMRVCVCLWDCFCGTTCSKSNYRPGLLVSHHYHLAFCSTASLWMCISFGNMTSVWVISQNEHRHIRHGICVQTISYVHVQLQFFFLSSSFLPCFALADCVTVLHFTLKTYMHSYFNGREVIIV